MGMVMDVEDDVFFADLNRQISLLISDDEDATDQSCYSAYYPSEVSIQQIQDFSRTAVIYPAMKPQYQFDHNSNYKTSTTDPHQQSKGTGVFIPKSSQFTKRRLSKHQTKTNTKTYNNYVNYNNSYKSNRNFKSSYRQHQQLPSQDVFAQVIAPKTSSAFAQVKH